MTPIPSVVGPDDADTKRQHKLLVKVLDFLGHMQLSEACTDLHLKLQAQCSEANAEALNQCCSALEELLELVAASKTTLEPLSTDGGALGPSPVIDEQTASRRQEDLDAWHRPRGSTGVAMDLSAQPTLVTYTHLHMGTRNNLTYRAKHTTEGKVVFHDPPLMSQAEETELAYINLPMIYNPRLNGLEDMPNLRTGVGTVIAGRYCSITLAGSSPLPRPGTSTHMPFHLDPHPPAAPSQVQGGEASRQRLLLNRLQMS
jgi:hypothetical protein